ncbi:MAG TPA: thermonuclease family protein [Anaerolineales bacterium]|nr:thermonuclease family protein [Anaerolineales bacterium]
MYEYKAIVLEVIDGDTLTLDVDAGFYLHYHVRVRLARINAPETVEFSARGVSDPAKEFVLSRCGPGTVVVARISKADKFGRWLAEILYLPGSQSVDEIRTRGKNLSDDLLAAGLAKLY